MMRIQENGNVGIGKSKSKLEVNGNIKMPSGSSLYVNNFRFHNNGLHFNLDKGGSK